ncbi:hypothetical protein AB0L55_36755 [Streptomyces anthocyanicus]|uniref:hypothetical protein n=1 Tax=Streptomyces anthocyanicus TaxID=68174 RepID=UPI00342F9811
MSTFHVEPINDLIEHDTSGHPCVCGPTERPEKHDDGTVDWIVVHNSLDGRELNEPDRREP